MWFIWLQAYLENYKFECLIDCHAPKPEYLNPFQILLRYNNFALSITYLFLWTRILISPIHIMYNNSWLIRSWLVKETKSVFLHTFLNLLNEVIPAAPYYIDHRNIFLGFHQGAVSCEPLWVAHKCENKFQIYFALLLCTYHNILDLLELIISKKKA